MTDDEIRDVFPELRRIGADLDRPPGLAIGTGFRAGELVPWLRSLPDSLGHDAFATRLVEHISAAEPNVVEDGAARHEHRLWPTVDQLNAGIDVLTSEWDPLGARLGALERDDVSTHAYNALGAILRGRDDQRAEREVARMLGDVEDEMFGVRPSPVEQRRYLARRLVAAIVEHPGPNQDENPFAATSPTASRSDGFVRVPARKRNFVALGPRGDELPPLDPLATCTECGSVGTVAVVMREVEPLVSRYCPSCWADVRGRYWQRSLRTLRVDEDAPESLIPAFDEMFEQLREQVRYTATSLWEDHFELARTVLEARPDASAEERNQFLRMMAAELMRQAPTMYGPMPPEVQDFVRQHGELGA